MKEKYGVWAVRGPDSVFGAAESWCKKDGVPVTFDTLEQAQSYAEECRLKATVNLWYYAKKMKPEESEVFSESQQTMGM